MSIVMVGPYPGPFDRSHYSDSLSVSRSGSRQILTTTGRQLRTEARPQAQRRPAAVPENQPENHPAPSYGFQQQHLQPWPYNSDAHLSGYSVPQEPPPPYTPMGYEPPPPPPAQPPVSQISSLTPTVLQRRSTRFLSVATVSAILLLTAVVTMALYVGSGGTTTRAPQKRAAAVSSTSAGGGADKETGTRSVSGPSPAASKRSSKLHGRTSPPKLAVLNKPAGKKAAVRRAAATQRRKSRKATRRTLPAPSTRGRATQRRANREVPAKAAPYDVGTSSGRQRQKTSPEATSAATQGTDGFTRSLATDGSGTGSQGDDRFRTWPSSTRTTTVGDERTTLRQEVVQEAATEHGPEEIGLDA